MLILLSFQNYCWNWVLFEKETIFHFFERYIWRWKLRHTPTIIWIIKFRKYSDISSKRYPHRPTCESLYWSQNEVSKSTNSLSIVNCRVSANQLIIIDPRFAQCLLLALVRTMVYATGCRSDYWKQLKTTILQLTFTCSKSTIETLEKGVKCVQK